MIGLRLAFLTVVASSISALPSLAAGESSSYVFCWNGMACAMDPCPSNSALDLATGKIIEGVYIDTTRLPWQDRARTDLTDLLYAGKIVVKGSIQYHSQKNPSEKYVLPRLVATGIVRTAKDSERKHCSSH